MKTITATIPAWITSMHTMADISAMSPENVASALAFYKPAEGHDAPDGWTKVGSAEITITFDGVEKVAAGQIAVLEKAKKKIQAETQAKLTAIDEQIGRLLCLEHKPEGAAL